MSEQEGGHIFYLCRRCGETYTDYHSPNAHASLAWPVLGVDLNPELTQHGQAPQIRGIHTCKDGGLGVADLIGAAEDKPKEKIAARVSGDRRLLHDFEAAGMVRMLRSRLCKLAKAGKVPVVRLPDGELRFDQDDLWVWVDAHKASPSNPNEGETEA